MFNGLSGHTRLLKFPDTTRAGLVTRNFLAAFAANITRRFKL
jgi:hypothetical protein